MGLPSRSCTGFVSAALCAVLLTACASTSDSGASSSGGFGGLFHKSDKNDKNVDVVPSGGTYSGDLFLKLGYCPPVEIRPDTEALILYDKGHEDDPDFVRFQASITDIARECHATGPETLVLKVGVAGRIAAGPKGGPGNVAATLRIAVVKQHGDKVLFSQPYKVTTAIGPPDFSAPFAQVADAITLTLTPDDRDLIIFVGFDEGKPKPKTKPTE